MQRRSRASRSSGCPTPPTRRSPATWRRSSRPIATWPWTTAEAPRPTTTRPGPTSCCSTAGVFASAVLRRAAAGRARAAGFARRRSATPAGSRTVLDNDRLDLAVARGAAYYGMVRRGAGRADRRRAGADVLHRRRERTSRRPCAWCRPAAEPGQDVDLAERRFDLLVSQAGRVSAVRLQHAADRSAGRAGADRPRADDAAAADPHGAAQPTQERRRTPSSVDLHARLTEIGTLDLWCSEVDGRGSWRLQFDVRSATADRRGRPRERRRERGRVVDEATWQACDAADPRHVRPRGQGEAGGAGQAARRRRPASAASDWPTSLLRRIWETLIELEAGRRRSEPHEARWLNLLGFALRPGYGLAVDDWRVAETWRLVQGNRPCTRPSAAAPSGGSSGGGSPAGWRRGSSRRWPIRCSAPSAPCTAS